MFTLQCNIYLCNAMHHVNSSEELAWVLLLLCSAVFLSLRSNPLGLHSQSLIFIPCVYAGHLEPYTFPIATT